MVTRVHRVDAQQAHTLWQRSYDSRKDQCVESQYRRQRGDGQARAQQSTAGPLSTVTIISESSRGLGLLGNDKRDPRLADYLSGLWN